MTANSDGDILRLMWNHLVNSGMTFTLRDGASLSVAYAGEEDRGAEIFRFAELEIGGVRMRGDVVFGSVDSHVAIGDVRYAVLHIVSDERPYLMDQSGERIPQLVLPIPDKIMEVVNGLTRSAGSAECGVWLGGQPVPVRLTIMDNLLWERIERKRREVDLLYTSCDNDWAQTLYVMLFRAMGGNRNKTPYVQLASRATYQMVLRERGAIDCVEALLLGSAGMLEGLYFDDYIRRLRDDFIYLVRKYDIMPMKPDEWERGVRTANQPLIRIVQLASFLARNDFMFDRVMNCRCAEDIHSMFDVELSGYWASHYSPDMPSGRRIGRIGEQKADLLAINAVVPVMMAYGEYTGNGALKEAAVDLLTRIRAESNGIVNTWSAAGVNISSAADSQAVIQLNNEYCLNKRCAVCKVGRGIIKMKGKGCEIQIK